MNELEVEILGVIKHDERFTGYDHYGITFNDMRPYRCEVYIKYGSENKWLAVDKDCHAYVGENEVEIRNNIEHVWDWNNYSVHLILGVMYDTNLVIRIKGPVDIRCSVSDSKSLLNYFLREGEFSNRGDDDVFILRYR